MKDARGGIPWTPVGFFLVAALWTLPATPGLAHDGEHGEEELQGTMTVVRGDDFERGRASVHHFLEEEDAAGRRTGRVLRLQGASPARRSGDRLRVRGRVQGDTFVLAAGGSSSESGGGEAAAMSGPQSTVVMLVNFQDRSVTSSVESVTSLMFTSPGSIDAYWQECSFGHIGFTGTVVGPYTISYSSSSTDYWGWADAADQRATQAGVNLALYSRKVYAMPPNGTGYGGLGTVGGNPSRAWVFYENPTVYAHELGHNLGLHHASTPSSEYGDATSVMGSGWMVHVNGPQKAGLGWIPSSRVVTASVDGFYSLTLVEQDIAATQLIRIPIAGSSQAYYLSYRMNVGFDANLGSSYVGRTSVHRWDGAASSRTTFDGAIGDGALFRDGASGLEVRQVAHSATTATVSVTFSPVLAPDVQWTPASQNGGAGQTLTYDVRITNRDATSEGSTAFSLSTSGPAGWTVSVSPGSVTLAPQASTTVTVSATAAATAGDGSYTLTLATSDGANAAHSTSSTAIYTIGAPPPRTARKDDDDGGGCSGSVAGGGPSSFGYGLAALGLSLLALLGPRRRR